MPPRKSLSRRSKQTRARSRTFGIPGRTDHTVLVGISHSLVAGVFEAVVFGSANPGGDKPNKFGKSRQRNDDQRNFTSASVVSLGRSSRIQWPVSFNTTT